MRIDAHLFQSSQAGGLDFQYIAFLRALLVELVTVSALIQISSGFVI